MYDLTITIEGQAFGIMKKTDMYLVTVDDTFLDYIFKEAGHWTSTIQPDILNKLTTLIDGQSMER